MTYRALRGPRLRQAVVAAITLALLELAARLLFIAPPVDGFNRVSYSQTFPPGQRQPPLVGGGYVWESRPDGLKHTHHLNSLGFRDREWSLDAGSQHRIAFIGDSFVEGFLASDTETIPAEFRRLAEQRGISLEVMNLGIGAAQPDAYCRLIRDIVPALNITHVLLVLYANDFATDHDCRAILTRPAASITPAPLLRPRLLFAAGVLAEHRVLPLRYQFRYPTFVPAAPHPGNPWSTNAEGLGRHVRPDIAADMKAAAFNPYAVNTALHAEAYLRARRDVGKVLRPIVEHVRSANIGITIYYIPYLLQVSRRYEPLAATFSIMPKGIDWLGEPYRLHERLIAAEAARLNVPFKPLTDSLRAKGWGSGQAIRRIRRAPAGERLPTGRKADARGLARGPSVKELKSSVRGQLTARKRDRRDSATVVRSGRKSRWDEAGCCPAIRRATGHGRGSDGWS
jgi:hypothetical protein